MDIRAQTIVGEQVETVNQEMPFQLLEITTKICTKIKWAVVQKIYKEVMKIYRDWIITDRQTDFSNRQQILLLG